MTADAATTPRRRQGRVLVAGIGNVFLGDDGFGVEVVNHIDPLALPATVDVGDYGIRGVHLAYELLDGRHDCLIMVDALPLDDEPGTVGVLDVTPDQPGAETGGAPVDAHGMSPQAVLALLGTLDVSLRRVLVVGCRPAVLDEGMGLSGRVAAAVAPAARLVVDLATEEAARLREGAELHA